ncbi:LacI family DNA-binding transcriptional regulator [Actinotalea sp. BY-33]|uniref:LacI family DNA-binding transcriptional regulator n=1 Tax=Actinotalea soli TaxID=2819234 RepID=A0A939LSA0_9CELL|nr:LacI family DNA-binding transcriptional regulator [Actinotalea soli]MBO1752135.1 LacI family DNA-binding transcriptional regulator [Actinotalea soli]
MVTIYDVASRAGVSAATVSRVLNGKKVREPYGELVRAAAEELGYQPSRTARSLRLQHADVIALIIPDIENPFFTSLARGVQDRAREDGYAVVLCNTDDDPVREREYFDLAVAEHMAGALLAPASSTSDVSPLLKAGRAVVAIDRHVDQDLDTVIMDNHRAALDATTVLVERGFRRIACITGPEDVETASQRADGWRAATLTAGRDPAGLLEHGDFRMDSGREAMRAQLDGADPPDAVVVGNSLMAVGALQAMASRGMTPPDFGMAVFGDLAFAPIVPAGIVIIETPARELGSAAASLLLARIKGAEGASRTVVVETKIRA